MSLLFTLRLLVTHSRSEAHTFSRVNKHLSLQKYYFNKSLSPCSWTIQFSKAFYTNNTFQKLKKKKLSSDIAENPPQTSSTSQSIKRRNEGTEDEKLNETSTNWRPRRDIVLLADLEERNKLPKEDTNNSEQELDNYDLEQFTNVELFTQALKATGLEALKNFSQSLGLTFCDESLLQKAFSHFVIGTEPVPEDQSHVRVGIELFRLLTTQYYVTYYPNLPKRFLTRVVDKVSSPYNAALRAKEIGFGLYIHLYPTFPCVWSPLKILEDNLQIDISIFKVPEKATFLLLKNTLFAFIASVFRDQGLAAAFNFAQRHVFEFYLKESYVDTTPTRETENVSKNPNQEISFNQPQKVSDPYVVSVLSDLDIRNSKKLLATLFVAMNKMAPTYRVLERNQQNSTVTCGVFSEETLLTTATAESVTEAYEKAAHKALLNFYSYKLKPRIY
jgi:dsRNA-specific ribonuclease